MDELEFRDRTRETKPDIVGFVETKLTREMKSNQIFLEGYVIGRKK